MSQDHSINLRVLAAVPRSGSTLLMRSFREAPKCAVTSRLVLMGGYETGQVFVPDYRIFENPTELHVYRQALAEGCSTLITKEELGHETKKGECTYAIFPTLEAYRMSKPIFLFRDPVRVFDSWKRLGWNERDGLIQSNRNLYQMWKDAPEPMALIYERLVADPAGELKLVCDFWGIEYNDKMTSFNHEFGDFFFETSRETSIYTVDQPKGIFDTVKHHNDIRPIASHGLLTTEDIGAVDQELAKLYMDIYGADLDSLKASLKTKTVFAFDLDDTLHEFRKASGSAANAVLERIASQNSKDVSTLQKSYKQILAQKTANAFVDGKTSTEYRKARFAALMDALNIPYSADQLDELATIYKTTLSNSLELKSGVIELFSKLKHLGKTIAIVTEGPEDAQIWTVEELGLSAMVDCILTTNKMGVSKTDGLFAAAPNHMKVSAEDVVVIGDNYDRDVIPAREQGILTVHYNEKENVNLGLDDLRVNTHWKVEALISE